MKLANLYKVESNLAEAKQMVERALDIEPENEEAQNLLNEVTKINLQI